MIPVRSVINYRHLLQSFVSKDIQGRFVGTLAGLLWTFINPFVNIVIYIFLFSVVLRIQVTTAETGTDQFVIYFLSGFLPWLLLSESLSRSAGILLDNANIITKVFFPIELLPASAVFSSFIISGIGMVLFLIYIACIGYFHITWLMIPLLIFIYFFFVLGIAFFMSALCVFIRDIREMLAIFLMLWFYATPIIYPASMLPDSLQDIISLNPLVFFMNGFRNLLLMHRVNWDTLTCILLISFFTFSIGSVFFMKCKDSFGDVL